MSYPVTWYPFTDHPDADSCWSLSVGPDGRIYVAACAEGTPGGIVKLVRYNRDSDSLDYLFDLDEKVDDPVDLALPRFRAGYAVQDPLQFRSLNV